MQFLYYFNSCPTCKNYERNLVRESLLAVRTAQSSSPASPAQSNIEVIERYILVLPQVWGEEAKKIQENTHTALPFLYNPRTNQALHIDHSRPTMASEIYNFLSPKPDKS